MSVARAYSVSYDFSGYQASNPADPLPGDKLDTELANIATSLNGTQSNVADIRRSDGALKDGIVTVDSLSADAVTQFTASVTTLANDAAASATSALNSKNAAATSASSASASATAAAASQIDAATSKTDAANSATSASNTFARLGSLFASFQAVFLGDLAADPTTDLQGNALIVGAQYFNTTTNTLRSFTADGWTDFSAEEEASNATLSAANAASSATDAATSATDAATSAADAATSETNAAASAAAAATSETNAAASAAAVATGMANFAGAVNYFPGDSAPNASWLVADGSLKNRADEPTLWAYAQVSNNLADTDGDRTSGQFSPGDGSTTFRIPKLGGLFIRALDNGAGVDADRVVGTIQTDAFKSHAHDVTDPEHNHTLTDPATITRLAIPVTFIECHPAITLSLEHSTSQATRTTPLRTARRRMRKPAFLLPLRQPGSLSPRPRPASRSPTPATLKRGRRTSLT